MTLEEALCWIDPDKRDPKIIELETASGIDTVDIIVQKFNEAGRIVCAEIYKTQKGE